MKTIMVSGADGQLVTDIIKTLQKEGDFQKAKEIIAKYSCIERSLDYAKVEVEKAINSISVIPNSSLKDALVEAAKFACLRDK